MQVNVVDIKTGTTLLDIVSEAFLLEGLAIPLEDRERFTSNLANEWGTFLITADELPYESLSENSEDCYSWIHDTLVEMCLKLDETIVDNLTERILGAVIDFMQPAFKTAWKELIGV